MLIDYLIYAFNRKDNRKRTAEVLAKALRFEVDNVVHYIGENTEYGKIFDLQHHIPNVAPLAPVMWFEYQWDIPTKTNKPSGVVVSIDYGCDEKIMSKKWITTDFSSTVRWILRIEGFWIEPEGIACSDWIYYIKVGEEGDLQDAVGIPSPTAPVDHKIDETERNAWTDSTVIALTAICFAHCKGAIIEEHQPSRQVRRAAEREKKPVFSFHTIDIEPSKQVLRTEGHISENGLAKALHICRGQNDHDTAEKPLFGKYTGTFYRPMHLRGKAEQGITIKDYRVHPSVPNQVPTESP